MQEPQAPPQLNFDIGDKEAEGIYSNFVMITHSGSEFILDFARMMPLQARGRVFARIVMTPQHVKAFFNALAENIRHFEERFGEVKLMGKEDEHRVGFQLEPQGRPKPTPEEKKG